MAAPAAGRPAIQRIPPAPPLTPAARQRRGSGAAALATQHTEDPMKTTTTDADRQLRADFRAFVLDQAEPWHRAHLGRLYALWDSWNAAHFAGQLVPPYVLLTPPQSPKALGDCASISSFGGRCQILINHP
jgi:hypothetical protein